MAEIGNLSFFNQKWLVRVARWCGYAAMAGAFVFLVVAAFRLDLGDAVTRLSTSGWVLSAMLSVAYGGSLILLAKSWAGCAAKPTDLSLVRAVSVYGPGVVAKYIPGSVFQYASRQVLGIRFGLSQGDMARASLLEAGLHLPAALLAGAFLYLAGGLAGPAILILLGMFVCATSGNRLVKAAGLQVSFFGSFAAIAYLLAAYALDMQAAAPIAALYMVAWVAGFLVPVAPGGIGIRESALLVLCAPYEQAPAVAIFMAITRLVTITGDAIIGLMAYLSSARLRSNRQASA